MKTIIIGSLWHSEKDKLNDNFKNTIDLFNVDRIAIFFDSYGQMYYVIPNKGWLSNASEFLDFNFTNFSLGGATGATLADIIKNNTYRYNSSLGFQDIKPTRCIMSHMANDISATSDSSIFQTNVLELIKTVRQYGAEPIFCSEFVATWGTGFETAMKAICDNLGIQFWNILPYTKFLTNGAGYANYWAGSHPGMRTGFVILDQFMRHAKELPRPKQSLKIFRKKSTVTVSTLIDLLFNDVWERMQLFKEIHIGHSALTAPTTYDAISTYNAANTVEITDEYLTLMAGGNVAFSDYALVEVVFPTTMSGVEKLDSVEKIQLNISATGTTIYILKEGAWTAITGGVTTDLKGCFDYDKVRFLIYKAGGFNLSSISVDWWGKEGKEYNVFNYKDKVNYNTELLTNLYFTDVNTGRTITGTLTAQDSPDGVYPKGCTKIVNVDADNYFSISIPNTATHSGVNKKACVRLACRYYPIEGTIDINEESLDWADLKFRITGQTGGSGTSYYTVIKKVGLHWTMIEMDIDLPEGTSNQELTVMGIDKTIEVAYISILKSV